VKPKLLTTMQTYSPRLFLGDLFAGVSVAVQARAGAPVAGYAAVAALAIAGLYQFSASTWHSVGGSGVRDGPFDFGWVLS